MNESKKDTSKNWDTIEGKKLSKTFTFPDFAQALAFTNQVGSLAEKVNHHPDIYLTWGKVRIELSTHDAGTITDLDHSLASKIDLIST